MNLSAVRNLAQRTLALIVATLAPHRHPAAVVVQASPDPADRLKVAAVGHYLAGQAVSLRAAYSNAAAFPELASEARMLQAGAAAADSMGEMLLAIVVGDREKFKAILNTLVDDAHETGVVTV